MATGPCVWTAEVPAPTQASLTLQLTRVMGLSACCECQEMCGEPLSLSSPLFLFG